MEQNIWTLLETSKQLPRNEQINLLHYLTQHLNQPVKIAYLQFLPAQLPSSSVDDETTPLFTDEEFENLLDWLEKIRHHKSESLKLAYPKIIKLIERLEEASQPDIPGWGAGADWLEEDSATLDRLLDEIRHHT